MIESSIISDLSSITNLTELHRKTKNEITREKWKTYEELRNRANQITVKALRLRQSKNSDVLGTPSNDYKKEKARLFVKKIRDEHLDKMHSLEFTTACLEKERPTKEKIRRRLKILGLEFNQVFLTPWEVQYWLYQYHKCNHTLSTKHIPVKTYTRLKQIEKDIKTKNKVPVFFHSIKDIKFIKGSTPTL